MSVGTLLLILLILHMSPEELSEVLARRRPR